MRSSGAGATVVAMTSPMRHRRVLVIANDSREAPALHDTLARYDDTAEVVVTPVFDTDPLDTMADVLDLFPADEIIVASDGDERERWLGDDLVGRACARFVVPVIDLPAEVPALAAA